MSTKQLTIFCVVGKKEFPIKSIKIIEFQFFFKLLTRKCRYELHFCSLNRGLDLNRSKWTIQTILNQKCMRQYQWFVVWFIYRDKSNEKPSIQIWFVGSATWKSLSDLSKNTDWVRIDKKWPWPQRLQFPMFTFQCILIFSYSTSWFLAADQSPFTPQVIDKASR